MQAITGSEAPTSVELSVPTAGTAKLKVYGCIRDAKAWMAHGTNAEDRAHDSREVFCRHGCGESWTGKNRIRKRRLHEAEICMLIKNRGTDEDWLQRKLDDAIRVPLGDHFVKNRFVDVDGVERCQFVVMEGLRVRCDLCDLVLPGADPVGDNPRADRDWLSTTILGNAKRHSGQSGRKHHLGQSGRNYLEQRKHLSLLNPGDSNSDDDDDDEITDEAPSRPDNRHVFCSHLTGLGLPHFEDSSTRKLRTVLTNYRGDRDTRKKKVLPSKLYDALDRISVIDDPAILEYRIRFADQAWELPKVTSTVLPTLEGASLEVGMARQALVKDEQKSFRNVIKKWSAAPRDDDMLRRMALLCAFQLLAVVGPGTGLLHPYFAKYTFDLLRGDVALVASFLENMSGPKLHAKVACTSGPNQVLADAEDVTCLGCNRSFKYGGLRRRNGYEQIECKKPQGGCGQSFAMLDDLITFRPGQVVKVPTEAFGGRWAKDHPGKTYTGKLLGVIEWPSTGRIWNVQYDRNEPPFPTGEEWFTAADADDA